VIAMLPWRRSLQIPAPDRAARLVERNALLYRRGWLLLVSGFIEPLLYLLAIGFGVGASLPPASSSMGIRSATRCLSHQR